MALGLPENILVTVVVAYVYAWRKGVFRWR